MKIGDMILHPRYGVGKIESVEDRELNGEIKQYYVVPKIGMSSVIYIPVDVADDSGVRYLYSEEYMRTAMITASRMPSVRFLRPVIPLFGASPVL